MLLSLLVAPALAAPLTHAEVARHDTAEDCWMVIDGQVYDATAWIAGHPGGEAILRGCGKDATWFWSQRDEAGGHSAQAAELLAAMRLGALGDEAPAAAPVVEVHPHTLRLEGGRVGLFPSAGVGPARSVALRVGHNISTGEEPSGIAIQAGYSFGRVDLVVSDEQSAGVGGVEVKGRLLDQHADAPKPLSLALVGGAGFAYGAGVPALYGQLVMERDLLDRRLALRANATGAMSPGAEPAGAASAGAGLEFRPIPVHGVFGEVQVPFADPAALMWTGGLRFYTRNHTFALFASSTPALSPWQLAGPAPQRVSVGMSLERAFRL